MDERQTDEVGDRHNGTGIADAARWDRGGHDADPAWSSVRAALAPPEPVSSSPRSPAHASAGEEAHGEAHGETHSEARGWHAPGLDDDTPPGGTPSVEPPLWREAARHARTPLAPSGWESSPPERFEPGLAEPDHPVRDPAPDGRTAGDRAVDGSTARGAAPAPLPDPPPADPGPVERSLVGSPPAGPPPAEPTVSDASLGDLPQRVPAEPDVPHVPEPREPVGAAPPAAAPQLARIADQLRRDDVPPEEGRTEGFDVDAVLDAVKDVAGVRAATLRANPQGAHTLRLDLHDNADPVLVSRVVARLLQERMGLSAAPQHVPHPRTPPDAAGADPPPARRSDPGDRTPGPRRHSEPLPATGAQVVVDQVQVHITGLDATVEVRLVAGDRHALGLASGPAIDSYVVRLAAVSAAKAIDELMREAGQPAAGDHARCFVEHTGVVPFGATEVAVVVVLLVSGGWVEQLAGSAVVDGDSRHAAVRATLGAVTRRLDALLAG